MMILVRRPKRGPLQALNQLVLLLQLAAHVLDARLCYAQAKPQVLYVVRKGRVVAD